MTMEFQVGEHVGVTTGNYAGKIGTVESVYLESERVRVRIDDHTTVSIHFSRLNNDGVLEFKERNFKSWLNNLPNVETWLKDQIDELEDQFEGVNHLNVFSNDDDYKKMVMLKYTLLEIKEGSSETT